MEAWDRDQIYDDLVGSAITDEEGAFRFEFDDTYFQELFLDRRPDLYFKVFRGQQLLHSTEDSVLWNVQAGDTPVTIIVDIPSHDKQPQTFGIKGRVSSRVSAAVGGLHVVVVDRCVGADQTLAETLTDSRGNYEVSFSNADVLQRGKPKPDLQVRVLAGENLIAVSDTRYNATPRETLNVLLKDEVSTNLASEYETLTGDPSRALRRQPR